MRTQFWRLFKKKEEEEEKTTKHDGILILLINLLQLNLKFI